MALFALDPRALVSGPQLENVFVQTLGNHFHAVRRRFETLAQVCKTVDCR